MDNVPGPTHVPTLESLLLDHTQEGGGREDESGDAEDCEDGIPHGERLLEIERLLVAHHILDGEDGDHVGRDTFQQEGLVLDQPLLGSRVTIVLEEDG